MRGGVACPLQRREFILHWRGQCAVLATSLSRSFALRATPSLVTLETVDSEYNRIHFTQSFVMTVYPGNRNVQVNNIFLSCVGGGSERNLPFLFMNILLLLKVF